MVSITITPTVALHPVSTPCFAATTWQPQNAVPASLAATRLVMGAALIEPAARYGTSGFAGSAVVADKHSRQVKPAAPPRGPR